MIRVSDVRSVHIRVQVTHFEIGHSSLAPQNTNDDFSPMFMTWRVPRGASKNGGKEISDADLDRAIRNQFQSTYGKR